MVAPAHAGDLSLTVNEFTGEAWIQNLSDSVVHFDGYEILSVAGLLDPLGWYSFEDLTRDEPLVALASLKSTGWSELVAESTWFSEGNLGNVSVAQPGFSLGLGTLLTAYQNDDLVFRYLDANLAPGANLVSGSVVIVPEPNAAYLAFCGALAFFLGRRIFHASKRSGNGRE